MFGREAPSAEARRRWQDAAHVLRRAPVSALSPDGLRCRARLRGGVQRWGGLALSLFSAFLAGEAVLEECAEALLSFLSKGGVDGEVHEVSRRASVVHIVGSVNSDAKLVDVSVSHELSKHVVRRSE